MSEPSVSTSLTLLGRLCAPADQTDRQDAWAWFFELYQPLFLVWARRRGFQPADCDNLIQIVMLQLLDALPRYSRKESGTFRGWLWRVLNNAATDYRRRRRNRPLVPIDAPDGPFQPSEEFEWDEAEYRQFVVRRALEIVSREFPERAVTVFTQHVVRGRPAVEVSSELGMPVGTVYSTCNRVLTRLRATITGLTD